MSAPIHISPVTCPQCGAPVTLPGYADLAVCPSCGSTLARTGAGAARSAPDGAPTAHESPQEPGRPAAGLAGAPAAPSAAQPPVAPSERQVLHSLSCPQCAGPLSVHAGRRILLCDHCGVRVLNYGEGGLSRWLFPQHTDQINALSAAARWLTDFPGIAKGARDVPVRHASLVHIPIWEHKCLVAGWEFGTKLRTKTYLVSDDEGADRLELAVEEERFQDPHLQERRHFQTGCDLAALGATRPRFSGRELLLPLVAGEVDPASRVLEPQGTAAEVAERGRKLALLPASGAADPHTQMLVLRESVSLLYYPLWLVDYQVADRPYRVVVDANHGTVNSGTAPAADQRLNPVLALRVAGLLAVAVFAAWAASSWAAARVPLIFLAVIVCIAAFLLVLRSPSGGKVEYHEPFSS
jgi:hypothetical protein